MYLVVISVSFRPISHGVAEVASDWGRSLILLRDSFGDRFGELVVAAPALPPGDGPIKEQQPMRLHAVADGIRFVKLGDTRWRARHFWRHYFQVRRICNRLVRQADILHAGTGNLYQPFGHIAFKAACRAGTTTVFVQDGDVIGRLNDLARGRSLGHRLKTGIYCWVFQRIVRRAVARASLCLLKGHAVHARYVRFARNARDFYDTSHSTDSVISPASLEHKCARIRSGGPIRCLSLGRLCDFKCVDHSIRAVVEAVRQGVPVSLDIIGDGPDEPRLRKLVTELEASNLVQFLGPRSYGPELLRQIADYDVLMFTSLADETPRSIFDGFAGGCALLAYSLPYTEQVIDETGAGYCAMRGDPSAITTALIEWHDKRNSLADCVSRAARAGGEHCAEQWYARRAEWTLEAHNGNPTTVTEDRA